MDNDLDRLMGPESREDLASVRALHDELADKIRITDPDTVESTLFAQICRSDRRGFPWAEELDVLPDDLAAQIIEHRRRSGPAAVSRMGSRRRDHPSATPPILGVFLSLSVALIGLFALSDILGGVSIALFCVFGPLLMIIGAGAGTRISRRLHRIRPRPEEDAEREIVRSYHQMLVSQYRVSLEVLAGSLAGDLADLGYRVWERDLSVTRVDTWILSLTTDHGPVVICADMCGGRITSSLQDPRLLESYQAAVAVPLEWRIRDTRELNGTPVEISGTTLTGIWA